MDGGGVVLELRGPVQWIRIDRPERRNAFDADVIRGIARGVV